MMMKVINEPITNEWASIIERPAIDASHLNDKVNVIINEVVVDGDAALHHHARSAHRRAAVLRQTVVRRLGAARFRPQHRRPPVWQPAVLAASRL